MRSGSQGTTTRSETVTTTGSPIKRWLEQLQRGRRRDRAPSDVASTVKPPRTQPAPSVKLEFDFEPRGGGHVVLSNTSKRSEVQQVEWTIDGNVGVLIDCRPCPADGMTMPPVARWVIAQFPPMSAEQRPVRIHVTWTHPDGKRHTHTDTLYI